MSEILVASLCSFCSGFVICFVIVVVVGGVRVTVSKSEKGDRE